VVGDILAIVEGLGVDVEVSKLLLFALGIVLFDDVLERFETWALILLLRIQILA